MGRRLAALLNGEVDKRDDDRADVVSRLASAAGIEENTVNQILNGSIDCPPLARLRAFASSLSVSLDSLISAGEADGCTYELASCKVPTNELAQHVPHEGESKDDFMRRCQAGGQTHDQCVLIFDNARLDASTKADEPEGGFVLSRNTDGMVKLDKVKGVPRFRKDILHKGVYTHPVHGWKLDITDERLNRMIAAFDAMKAKGVDVELVTDHSSKAEAIHGYVDAMRRANGSIEADIRVTSETGPDLVTTVKNVSVGIERDYSDGKGNSFGEAISHIAIVQQPVVPGQQPFVPLSRSGTEVETPVLMLQNTGEGNTMDLEQIRELLGAGDDLTAENAFDRIKEHMGRLEAEKKEAQTELVKAQGDLQTAKAASLKNVKPVDVDPDTLEDLAETAEDRLAELVKNGNVTPAVSQDLSTLLIGNEGSRNAICLSRKANGGSEPLARKVIKILDKNNPVDLAEQTGMQVIEMGAMYREDDAETKAAKTQVDKNMTHLSRGDNGQLDGE